MAGLVWIGEHHSVITKKQFQLITDNPGNKLYHLLPPPRPPPPSTFDTIHPIDLKFGTYNRLHLYFQLSKTTWCLIGFHDNNSQINGVTGGRHLGFSNFQILFKFSLFYFRLTGKQHLAVEIHEIGRIH